GGQRTRPLARHVARARRSVAPRRRPPGRTLFPYTPLFRSQGLLQVMGIAASLLAGRVIDRTRAGGQSGLVVLFSGMSAVAVVGELLAPGWWPLWIVLLGLGTAASFVTALSFSGLRTVDHAQAAALSGMAQALGYGLAALGPVLLGGLHDATSTWTVPLVVLLVLKAPEIVAGALAGRRRVIGG